MPIYFECMHLFIKRINKESSTFFRSFALIHHLLFELCISVVPARKFSISWLGISVKYPPFMSQNSIASDHFTAIDPNRKHLFKFSPSIQPAGQSPEEKKIGY